MKRTKKIDVVQIEFRSLTLYSCAEYNVKCITSFFLVYVKCTFSELFLVQSRPALSWSCASSWLTSFIWCVVRARNKSKILVSHFSDRRMRCIYICYTQVVLRKSDAHPFWRADMTSQLILNLNCIWWEFVHLTHIDS